ncbi:uncharacterized protein LOC130741642 isoform X1 [Lotus japonicus]|uniref:uncharacterized protein LOC130741642 isoform X1 n=1 Tax=Lotus japonicus TaxID=34305 RepID=UPI00258E76AA|nr:uncharacterized protein LOC130741642 isoform X1 [Lotus japonicus]
MSAGYRGSPWQRRSQCSCLRCVRHQFEVAAVGAFFRDVYCSFFGNSKSDSLSMRLGLSRITMAVAKPAFFAPVLKDHRRLMTSFFVASLHYFRQVPNNSHLIFSFQFTQVFIFFFPFVKEKGTQTKIFLKSLFGFTSGISLPIYFQFLFCMGLSFKAICMKCLQFLSFLVFVSGCCSILTENANLTR